MSTGGGRWWLFPMLGKGLVQSLQIGVGDFIWENETWLIWGDEGIDDFSTFFFVNHPQIWDLGLDLISFLAVWGQTLGVFEEIGLVAALLVPQPPRYVDIFCLFHVWHCCFRASQFRFLICSQLELLQTVQFKVLLLF